MEMKQGLLLRIFLSETEKHDGRPLYEWIAQAALGEGLSGATVLRGLLGYGCRQELHSAKILRLSEDLPLVVEIVDDEERIHAFLPSLEGVIEDGLVTLERVRYRSFSRC